MASRSEIHLDTVSDYEDVPKNFLLVKGVKDEADGREYAKEKFMRSDTYF